MILNSVPDDIIYYLIMYILDVPTVENFKLVCKRFSDIYLEILHNEKTKYIENHYDFNDNYHYLKGTNIKLGSYTRSDTEGLNWDGIDIRKKFCHGKLDRIIKYRDGVPFYTIDYDCFLGIERIEYEVKDYSIHGMYREYFYGDKISKEGMFLNSVKINTHKEYRLSGLLKIKNYDDKSTKHYFNDILRATGNFNEYGRTGKWIFYSQDGSIQCTQEYSNQDNKVTIYKKGVIKEIFMKRGTQRHGVYERYANGRMIVSGTYWYGKQKGTWQFGKRIVKMKSVEK